MTKKESFKAVEFMRKRRDELSELQEKDLDAYTQRLAKLREKYAELFRRSGREAA